MLVVVKEVVAKTAVKTKRAKIKTRAQCYKGWMGRIINSPAESDSILGSDYKKTTTFLMT